MLGIGAGADPTKPWASEHHERGIPLQASLADRQAAVIRQIEHLRRVEPTPVIIGVNSDALARIAGQHADGVNVRLSSPNAARQIAAAREAAGDRPFDCSGWAHHDDERSRELALELGLDRLIELRWDLGW